LQEFREQVLVWAGILGPNIYLKAAVATLGFVLAGKIAELLISKVLLKIVSRSSSKFDDELVKLLQRPVFITFVLTGFATATRILGFPESALFITLGALRTIAIFIWYGFFRNAFTTILAVVSTKIGKGSSLSSMLPLVETVASAIMLALAIYFVFLAWDVNVTAWLASAGIIGLALSFAAKDTLANLFAGVSIAADAPYTKGDFIILDSGERGMVTHIGLRSTRLLTRDDVEIVVPNGVMGSTKIVNESGGPHEKFRIRIKVGVAYGTDIDKVIEILNSVARNHAEVCKTPEPRVRFRTFGESGLDFELLAWVEQPVLRGRVVHELNYQVYQEFNRASVQIPFPQRDLYIKEMPQISSS